MSGIDIIPLSAASRSLPLDAMATVLTRVFHVPARVRALQVPVDRSFDRSRNQYHSSTLLTDILAADPGGATRLLGVATVDLFIPILTFVYGQAQVAGRAAVFSTFRLHNELYGLPPSTPLLHARATKEAMHELGHTFGLRHCAGHPCVMNSSTYVEEIDLKPELFCEECRRVIDAGA